MALSRKHPLSTLTSMGPNYQGPATVGLNQSQATGAGDALKSVVKGSQISGASNPKKPGDTKGPGKYPFMP